MSVAPSTGWPTSTSATRPWWPAAHQFATTPALILTTGLVAAMGMVGLCHRGMPLRGPFAGLRSARTPLSHRRHPALLGSLVDGPVRDLLDGVLAPLRNVHKVDPVVRLPLALGVAHFAALPPALTRRFARPVDHAGRGDRRGRGGGGRSAAGQRDDADAGLPRYPRGVARSRAVSRWQPQSRALVLPGSGFAFQNWGWTIDEPMQGVATSPWVTRSQVPLVPGATARYLDTIERRITSGEGGAGLADLLARGRDHSRRPAP